MSAGPTDPAGRRTRSPAAAALLAAALACAPAAPAARAADEEAPGGPVFFRNPDPLTAKDIAAAVSLFGDPSPNVKERARDRLFEIGWWSVAPLLETVKERQGQFRTNAYLVLGRLGDPRALPALRSEVLQDSEWPPAVAALMLGRMRDADDAAIAAFRSVMKSDAGNHLRRRAVCLALAKLHHRRPADCVPILEEALAARSANPAVHQAALLALGFFRSRISEALPDGSGSQPRREIREYLKDRDAGMRLSAVLAMSVAYVDDFHPVFVDVFQKDGDRQVRLAALLALGRDRRDPATTALLARVLGNPTSSGEEGVAAAYLLGRRPDLVAADPKAFDALSQAATAQGSQETAAAALVALAGVDDPRVPGLLVSRLGAGSATVRAAAAFGSVRLRSEDGLRQVRRALAARIRAGEPDENAREDMRAAAEEIDSLLKDRADAAAGLPPVPRPAPRWREADTRDLFLRLSRDERQATFDLVNLRALQVLGIDSLFAYRPSYDPAEPAESLGGVGTKGMSVRPDRPVKNEQSEQYDVRVELSRRPYFSPEADDPDAPAVPIPRESR